MVLGRVTAIIFEVNCDVGGFLNKNGLYVHSIVPKATTIQWGVLAIWELLCIGASLIRMVRMFLGEDLFDKGIKSYMSRGQFSWVIPDNLWNSWIKIRMNDILPTNLLDLMEGWTDESMFPLVSVTRTRGQVEIATVSYRGQQTADRWYIPITYTTSKKPNFEETMPKKGNWIVKAGTLTLDEDLSGDSWIVVNLQYAAYIRVTYDEGLWNALAAALKRNHRQIHVLNRAQIVHDVLYLLLRLQLDFSTALNILGYLRNEVDYHPWYGASLGFNVMKQRLEDGVMPFFYSIVRPLFRKFYESVSSDTDHLSSLKRALAHKFACEMGIRKCINKMNQLFKGFVEENKEVDPNLRFVVYCTGLKSKVGEKYREAFYERLNKTNIPSEANTIINALGCTDNEELLKLYLKKLIEGSLPLKPDDSEDVHKVLMSIFSNSRKAAAAVLDFYNENTKDVAKYKLLTVDVKQLLLSSIRTEIELEKLKLLAEKPEMKEHSEDLPLIIELAQHAIALNKDIRRHFLNSLDLTKKSAGVIATFSKPLFISFVAALVGGF